MLTGDGRELDDVESASGSPGPHCSRSSADTRSCGTDDMGRRVFWPPGLSLLAPAPAVVARSYSLNEPRSAPRVSWALRPGPLSSPGRPVLLGRLSPPLWHGPLPSVGGQFVPGYLLAVSRLHDQTREGGRAPLDDGTHEWFHSPGDGARWPTWLPALSLRGGLGRRVPGVTLLRVPAGGGCGILCGHAVFYYTCGNAINHVRCPLLIVLIVH